MIDAANDIAGRQTCQVAATTVAPDWQGYLAGHPAATIYHDPRWPELMRRAYGLAPLYLTARRDGRTVGVLQLVHQNSRLFGSHLCSLPWFDAAGVAADNGEAAAALQGEARQLLDSCRAAWVELRQAERLAGDLPCRDDKATMHLALPADPDELWTALDAKVRNQVRKAEKAGLRAQQGGGELVGEFYEIYSRNMRDLGSPPHALRFFRMIAETFGASCRVFVVRQGDRPLAASVTLADRTGRHVPWAGSDWRFRESNANMLLYWTMLAEGCRGGPARFDFGRGTRDSGTWRFKKQWGAVEVPLYWHYLLPPDGRLPELQMDNPKFRLAVALWKRLPVGLARTLGPRLIAGLS